MQGRIMRRALLAAGTLAVLALAGAAFAFFTTAGEGTGTASVTKNAPSVTITGTTEGELYPGGSAKVHVTIKAGAEGGRVNTVTLSSVEPDATHSACQHTVGGEHPAFTMAAISVEQTLAANESVEKEGSLTMNNLSESQDACKGATLTLHFTSS